MQSLHGTATSNTPRPGTPESDPVQPAHRPSPFASPYASTPASAVGSSTGIQALPPPRYFHSRRINKGEVAKPWLDKKDPREKWTTVIPIAGIVVGLTLAGFLIHQGLQSVHNHTYCPVLDDDFSGGLNDQVWTKEVEVGGFGNGQFEMTTGTDENAFIQHGMLVLKPTLQDARLVESNTVIDLRQDGSCSSDRWSNCVAVTNTTNGTIVNPVKSARISTKKAASIRYGRVEVEARLPEGDWLWPAIWMLPVRERYGPWPSSGEIDIAESRGNNRTHAQGGNNVVSSTLHWGPDAAHDAWWRHHVKRAAPHAPYSAGYHTFGLEWSERYLFTYVDSRLLHLLYAPFRRPFWPQGRFPAAAPNGSRLVDPWSHTGRPSTPFDHDFYLVLNLAVGATNGWFQDGRHGKPWVDASPTAARDFWNARHHWYPTWAKQGQMNVRRVRMWQQQGYNGC